jgi:hypothetical protein
MSRWICRAAVDVFVISAVGGVSSREAFGAVWSMARMRSAY